MQSPCSFAINSINLLLNTCFSYQGTATQKGLKCNEKALLDLAFFQHLKKKFKLAIVTGRPRKVRIVCDLMLRSTGFQFVFFALLSAAFALLPCEFNCVANHAQDCMEFLALHSLSSLFDSIVTMDDAPLKPSPEPIHLAMRLAGGSRGIMFGDTKVCDA